MKRRGPLGEPWFPNISLFYSNMNKASLEQLERIKIVEDASIVNLNTQYAVPLNGTYLSNVSWPTNGLILPSTHTDRVEVQVLNIQLPVSFYVVTDSNNSLRYLIGTTAYEIKLALGNYSFQSFYNELVAKFTAISTVFTIGFDYQVGVLIFSYTSAFTFLNTSTCQYVVGFKDTMVSSGNSLTMPYPLNLLGPKKIKLFSNTLPTTNYDSGGLGSCLISFSQTAPPYDLLCYENATNHRNILRTNIVNSIDLLLTDEYNVPLNMNNTQWSITIRLSTFRYNIPSLSTFHQILDDQKFFLNEEDAEYGLEVWEPTSGREAPRELDQRSCPLTNPSLHHKHGKGID